MLSDTYIAGTYLKILAHSDSGLAAPLHAALGENAAQILASDFVYGADIERIFKFFAEQGLDSWLLRFGKQLSVASHGPLGFAVLSAPNLGSAMTVLADYTIVRSSAYQAQFSIGKRHAEFTLFDNTGGGLIGQWLIENALYVTQRLIETVMAHSLGEHAKISFTFPEPSYSTELESFYGVRCKFNAPRNAICIPASWSRISSPLSDPVNFKLNLAKCRETKMELAGISRLTEAISIKLQNYFEARLAGELTTNDLPSLQSLANAYHVSSRTLTRKLKEQNSSYKELLESARKTQAINLLGNTHLSIADIAYNLAYQEPANFVRAFKKWFDITPAAWRRQPKTPTQENKNYER